MKYFFIRDWMISELGLKGSKLLIFALIFSASCSENRIFYGNSRTIAKTLNISQATAINSLKYLDDKKLIDNRHSDFSVNRKIYFKFSNYKSERYTKIKNWMLDPSLNLTINELIVFSCIYNVAENNHSMFTFNPTFFTNFLGMHRTHSIHILNSLLEKNLLEKQTDNFKIRKPPVIHVPVTTVKIELNNKDRNLNVLEVSCPDFEIFESFIKTNNLKLERGIEKTYQQLSRQNWCDEKGNPIRNWRTLLQKWNDNYVNKCCFSQELNQNDNNLDVAV